MLIALVAGLVILVGVAGWPLVEPTSLDAVEARAGRLADDVVEWVHYDDSTGTLEIQLASGATDADGRRVWCEVVGHAAIAQGLPIDTYRGYEPVPVPSDCGAIDDGVATLIVIVGLWLLAGCVLVVISKRRRPIVQKLARQVAGGHRALAGGWSSVLASLPVAMAGTGVVVVLGKVSSSQIVPSAALVSLFLPIAVIVAAVTGAVFGAVIARQDRGGGSTAYAMMAILEVVMGAYLTGIGLAALDGSASAQPFSVGYAVVAGTIGLVVLGIPALLATGAHVGLWRSLFEPAVQLTIEGDAADPTPSRAVAQMG